jgi:hypothetical protein
VLESHVEFAYVDVDIAVVEQFGHYEPGVAPKRGNQQWRNVKY